MPETNYGHQSVRQRDRARGVGLQVHTIKGCGKNKVGRAQCIMNTF